MTTSKELAAQNTAMVRPDFIPKGDKTGTEHITRDDIQMPRLAIAQSLSPQLDPSNGQFIEGLSLGHLFNSLTKQNLKTGPIEFYILRADPPRWVEFIPREQGGGVKDPNVPAGDPRTKFVDGRNPIATKFYDFIICMLPVDPEDPMRSIIALSMKSTGLKVARRLNGLVTYRQAPIYSGRYVITTVDEQNTKGKYKNYSVDNAGWAENPETLAMLKQLHEEFKDREVSIHRDEDPDPVGDADERGTSGDTTFDPNAM